MSNLPEKEPETTHESEFLNGRVEEPPRPPQETCWGSMSKDSRLPPEFDAVQNNIFSRTTKGTCNWILENREFKQWAGAVGLKRTLWLHGLPGGGKTFATSIVVNHLLQDPEIKRRCDELAYIYCNHQLSGMKAQDLIFNIVKQIFIFRNASSNHNFSSTDIISYVRRAYCSSNLSQPESPSSLSLDECMQYLCKRTSQSQLTYVIIDAIDECPDVNHLLNILQTLYESTNNIRLLITSRSLGIYQDRLGNKSCIEVRATKDNVLLYIKQSIRNSIKFERALARDLTLEPEITKYILDNMRGMFLLPRLWLDWLNKQHSPREIRRILWSIDFKLPVQLLEFYADSMQRIEKQDYEDMKLAHKALAWIVKANEPLVIGALTHALGTSEADTQFHEDGIPQPDDIVSVCAGLLTIDHDKNPKAVLAHPTLIGFFNQNLKLFSFNEELIPRTCLTYLSTVLPQLTLPETEEDYEAWTQNALIPMEITYPLLRYACNNWSIHARESATSELFWKECCEFLRHRLPEATLIILIGGRNVGRIPDSESLKLPPADISPMHMAVLFNIPKVIGMLFEGNSAKLGIEDSNGNTPLIWAAYNNRAEIVRKFLEWPCRKSKLDFYSVGATGKGAIYHAAEQGSVNVLELLSEQANIDPNEAEISQGLTPVIIAARNSHLEILSLLLQRFNAEVDLGDTSGATPLLHACRAGHTNVARFLLDHGANVTSETNEGDTPLEAAILGCHETLVMLLLEYLNKAKYSGHVEDVERRAVFKVARSGSTDAFQSILDIPTYLQNLRKNHDRLHLTSLQTRWELENITDTDGRSPLSHAVEAGHLNMTKKLLEYSDFKTLVRDTKHWTPLHYAVYNGNFEILQLLLSDVDFLHFCGPKDPEDYFHENYEPEDGSENEDSDPRHEWDRIFKKLSLLVTSSAFIRPGQSKPLAHNPAGILPCVQLLLDKFQPSRRLNLMVKRILHQAALQTIIHHPDHKNRLDELRIRRTSEFPRKWPVVESVRLGNNDRGAPPPPEDSTDLLVELVTRKGARMKVVLECGPTEDVESDIQ